MSEQYHFEFNRYEEAFEMFYRKKQGYTITLPSGTKAKIEGNPNICLVLSTAFYTSGYWIEENAKSDKDSRVYRSVKAVKELEKRVREQDAIRNSREINPDRGKLVV